MGPGPWWGGFALITRGALAPGVVGHGLAGLTARLLFLALLSWCRRCTPVPDHVSASAPPPPQAEFDAEQEYLKTLSYLSPEEQRRYK